MLKSVAIVGAGINGLLTAFLLTEKYPELLLNVYEAENNPLISQNNKGVTYGSRDARHITGSESIGFESSIHKNALRNAPEHDAAGWLLKDEIKLTAREKQWRDKFEASYTGSDTLNDLDYAHAELNYKGLAAWNELVETYPFIGRHVINNDGVEVYFTDKSDFEDDLIMETDFCQRYFKTGKVQAVQNETLKSLYSKKLVVPGMSIRVKSLATEILERLESNNIRFHWERTVSNGDDIETDVVVWTAGVTHAQPSEYQEHDVQGIVGCWVTIPNRGYKKPFKIATPAPAAYINCTPDGNDIHVSGGFGWTGEHADPLVISESAKPMANHFTRQINQYLGTSMTLDDVDYCVRPSTPTGQPLLLTESLHSKTNIYITGSAKSGTTHAPVLSEYVIEQIDKRVV